MFNSKGIKWILAIIISLCVIGACAVISYKLLKPIEQSDKITEEERVIDNSLKVNVVDVEEKKEEIEEVLPGVSAKDYKAFEDAVDLINQYIAEDED